MIADRVSTKNAIDFIQNVETAALAASAAGAEAPAVGVAAGGTGGGGSSSGGNGGVGVKSHQGSRNSVPAEPVAVGA